MINVKRAGKQKPVLFISILKEHQVGGEKFFFKITKGLLD